MALVFKVVALSCVCLGFGQEDPLLLPNTSTYEEIERFSCPGKENVGENCGSWRAAKRSDTESHLLSNLVLENILRICSKMYPD